MRRICVGRAVGGGRWASRVGGCCSGWVGVECVVKLEEKERPAREQRRRYERGSSLQDLCGRRACCARAVPAGKLFPLHLRVSLLWLTLLCSLTLCSARKFSTSTRHRDPHATASSRPISLRVEPFCSLSPSSTTLRLRCRTPSLPPLLSAKLLVAPASLESSLLEGELSPPLVTRGGDECIACRRCCCRKARYRSPCSPSSSPLQLWETRTFDCRLPRR